MAVEAKIHCEWNLSSKEVVSLPGFDVSADGTDCHGNAGSMLRAIVTNDEAIHSS